MIVKKISFIISLINIFNIYDNNVDGFVGLQNGRNYTVVVRTYKNIISLMDEEKSNFLPSEEPLIIIRELTIKGYSRDHSSLYIR